MTAPVVECLGVPITAHTRDSAARHVVHLAGLMREARQGLTDEPGTSGSRRGSDVHLSNAYTLALADRDPELRDILRSAALNLPDGQPVVWANRLLHPTAVLPSTRGAPLPVGTDSGPTGRQTSTTTGRIIGRRR